MEEKWEDLEWDGWNMSRRI